MQPQGHRFPIPSIICAFPKGLDLPCAFLYFPCQTLKHSKPFGSRHGKLWFNPPSHLWYFRNFSARVLGIIAEKSQQACYLSSKVVPQVFFLRSWRKELALEDSNLPQHPLQWSEFSLEEAAVNVLFPLT
ncbi:hypothetical protein AVEN_248996-1 [Araneus ventricosus]|uniref:Uncharacterized protein n=1 Tax=Araneus ventricosus TaxID=182803 RepID=A0A4Y2G8Q5_ARAVE|nr:hypothetical protein AVEN_248996-1 [Araneus ventricosus]